MAKSKVIRSPATAQAAHCYLCGRSLQADDKVVRVHETTMHRACYETDILRGR